MIKYIPTGNNRIKKDKVKRKHVKIYKPENYLTQSDGRDICAFCLRTVYFDSQHLNAKGTGYPHDHPVESYRNKANIPHHGEHCPDINGNEEDRKFYEQLRIQKGVRDPWYHKQQQQEPEQEQQQQEEEEEEEVVEEEIIDTEEKLQIQEDAYILVKKDHLKAIYLIIEPYIERLKEEE